MRRKKEELEEMVNSIQGEDRQEVVKELGRIRDRTFERICEVLKEFARSVSGKDADEEQIKEVAKKVELILGGTLVTYDDKAKLYLTWLIADYVLDHLLTEERELIEVNSRSLEELRKVREAMENMKDYLRRTSENLFKFYEALIELLIKTQRLLGYAVSGGFSSSDVRKIVEKIEETNELLKHQNWMRARGEWR